jgi:ABC-type nitrate/sulfonate/bicarbonate transport system substrate-binding protein
MVKKNFPENIIIIVAVIAFAAITVTVLSHVRKEKQGSRDVVIKVADASTTPNSWDLVTKLTGRDILKEEGVNLKKIPGTSTAPSFQALLSGQYDVAGWAWMGWVNVIAKGGKIKAVDATGAITKEQNERSGILVLEKSGIRTIQDLRGKTIAVNTLGLNAEYVIKLILRKNGIPLDQVQLLQMPTENMEQALRAKQVNAAIAPSGGIWLDLALDRGGVLVIPGTRSHEVFRQDATSGGTGFRVDFIQAHPDAVRRYVTAVEKAKRIIWDAFQKNPEIVRKAYAEIAKEKGGNPQFGKYYLPVSPDLTAIKDKDIQYWIDVLVSEGKLKPGQIKPSDVYTNEFNTFLKDKQNTNSERKDVIKYGK